LRGLSVAAGMLCLIAASVVAAQDDLVANPFYTYWSSFKPGTTAVHLERTKLSGPESELVPDGVEEKRIAYTLVETGSDRVVLEMVVTENDFLGHVQSSPTRYIYPARIKKTHLQRIIEETGAKTGDEVVKLDGREVKCTTVAGTTTGANGEQVEYRVWLSAEVPGNLVKKVRTTRQNGALVAETTTTLESYKKSE
jgi:hypothetical protein